MLCISSAFGLEGSDARAYYAGRGKSLLDGKITASATIGPGHFVINDDVYVTQGAELRILPGTTLFFRNRSRLEIAGTLKAIGDGTEGITFRSLPFDMYFRNPYSKDSLWEGIILTETGNALLSKSQIRDARYGIRAPLGCRRLAMSDLMFTNIPESVVELAEVSEKVKPDQPVSLTYPLPQNSSTPTTATNMIAWSELSTVRKISLASLGVGTVGFASLAVYEYLSGNRQKNEGFDRLKEVESKNNENSAGIPHNSYDSWEENYDKSFSHFGRMSIYSILGAACAVGFVFTIPSPKRGKR